MKRKKYLSLAISLALACSSAWGVDCYMRVIDSVCGKEQVAESPDCVGIECLTQNHDCQTDPEPGAPDLSCEQMGTGLAECWVYVQEAQGITCGGNKVYIEMADDGAICIDALETYCPNA